MQGRDEGAFALQGRRVFGLEADQGVDGVRLALCSPNGAPRARPLIPGRLFEARWCHFDVPTLVLAAYAPGDRRPREVRQAFWHALRDTCKRIRTRRRAVVAGDFNARLGADEPSAWAGAACGAS